MEILVPAIGALVIGVVIGGIVARVSSPRAAIVTAALGIAAAAVSWGIGAQQQGLDGVGYSIVAMVLLAPMAAGCGVVGLIAWFGMRRGSGDPAP